jgi:SAM-dependent methyltransferase
VGVDHSATQLAKARHTNRYHRCCQADARDLPFGNGEFRSVLSVSVLEHVPQPEAVLAEVHRVLRPGGRFVATVVLADLHEHLLFPRLFSRLRLPLLGRLYRRAHDALFGHRTLLPKEEWERLLGEAGFQVLVSKKVVSPSLTRWWDCLLLTAWPYLLYRPRRLWRPRWFRALAASLCRRTQAEAAEEGSVLLVVAQKPAAEDRSQPGPPPAPAAVKVPVLA